MSSNAKKTKINEVELFATLVDLPLHFCPFLKSLTPFGNWRSMENERIAKPLRYRWCTDSVLDLLRIQFIPFRWYLVSFMLSAVFGFFSLHFLVFLQQFQSFYKFASLVIAYSWYQKRSLNWIETVFFLHSFHNNHFHSKHITSGLIHTHIHMHKHSCRARLFDWKTHIDG